MKKGVFLDETAKSGWLSMKLAKNMDEASGHP